jgi:hypothetical protein
MEEMDLHKMWRKSTEDGEEKPEYDIKAILSGKPNSPLSKLKRNLHLHMVYGAGSIFLFAWLTWLFPYNAVFVGSGLVIAISIFFLGQLSVLVVGLEQLINSQPGNLLEALRQHQKLIGFTFKVQQAIALPFYSVSFMLGIYIGFIYDTNAADLSYNFQNCVLVGILTLMWTFLAHKIERWMNQKAFGVHLDHMKEIISQLEQEVV